MCPSLWSNGIVCWPCISVVFLLYLSWKQGFCCSRMSVQSLGSRSCSIDHLLQSGRDAQIHTTAIGIRSDRNLLCRSSINRCIYIVGGCHVALHMFDCNSNRPLPLAVLSEAHENCSLTTSWRPPVIHSDLSDIYKLRCVEIHWGSTSPVEFSIFTVLPSASQGSFEGRLCVQEPHA